VESHFDLVGHWFRKHGRPRALYTDRASICEPSSKGRPDYAGPTQLGRALEELAMELIRAPSSQAKGRVERFFERAPDRWVKELRLAGIQTRQQANALLRERRQPESNRRFPVPARDRRDAPRALGAGPHLAAIRSVPEQRVVANDYTIRFADRLYQLELPAWPGERGGKVVIEQRRDGTMALRFGGPYLQFHEGGAVPSACHEGKEGGESGAGGEFPSAAGGREKPAAAARSPEEKGPPRPAATHPWRRTFLKRPK
jgi:hypothetical protein